MANTAAPSDLPTFHAWLGKTREDTDRASPATVRRVAALLNRSEPHGDPGEHVPAHWYFALFTPSEPQSSIGIDGHPRTGDFLPPIALPRRMFAGRRVSFHQALRVDEPVVRRSRIQSITPKRGRSGEMCFVTVRHEISGPRGLLVTEEQDIVYRDAPASNCAAPESTTGAEDLPGSGEFSMTFTPDPALLFRYSAITFNAHRIHYDLAYARDVEGYPERVVNGGLTTLMLWEFVANRTSRSIRASQSRNVKALFVNRPVTLRADVAPDGQRARAVALGADGELAMQLELELAVA